MAANSGLARPLGALVLALLALAGCARLESVKDRLLAPQPSASGAPAADGVVVQPAAKAVPPLPKRKPTVGFRPRRAPPDPDQVFGLDFHATRALLGLPAGELERPPAKVWTYDGGICMFNVFFYPSVDDKVFRVLAYEVTEGAPPPLPAGTDAGEPDAAGARNKSNPLVRRCFAEVLHNSQEPNAG